MQRNVADLARPELEVCCERDAESPGIDGERLDLPVSEISDRPALEKIEAKDGGFSDIGCEQSGTHSLRW